MEASVGDAGRTQHSKARIFERNHSMFTGWRLLAFINGVMRKLYNPKFIGAVVIVVLVTAIVLIDDVSSSRRSAMLTAIFGAAGTLWLFRLICMLFIGLALWAMWHDMKSQRRIARIIAQRESLDKSISRDK
ncbi:hypothetical protein N2597_11365 [Rhizobium sophoriradicis]|uniref:hypothetical protein n=1 Tax=Rhizobium sophoriradicis TaxID=1535245 RepID=UPI00160FA7BD|nr:hypothetical protein N2597_11365 [Rhizobium leguminosarum bv. phaseoli]